MNREASARLAMAGRIHDYRICSVTKKGEYKVDDRI